MEKKICTKNSYENLHSENDEEHEARTCCEYAVHLWKYLGDNL